jgi:hypothetical protein
MTQLLKTFLTTKPAIDGASLRSLWLETIL